MNAVRDGASACKTFEARWSTPGFGKPDQVSKTGLALESCTGDLSRSRPSKACDLIRERPANTISHLDHGRVRRTCGPGCLGSVPCARGGVSVAQATARAIAAASLWTFLNADTIDADGLEASPAGIAGPARTARLPRATAPRAHRAVALIGRNAFVLAGIIQAAAAVGAEIRLTAQLTDAATRRAYALHALEVGRAILVEAAELAFGPARQARPRVAADGVRIAASGPVVPGGKVDRVDGTCPPGQVLPDAAGLVQRTAPAAALLLASTQVRGAVLALCEALRVHAATVIRAGNAVRAPLCGAGPREGVREHGAGCVHDAAGCVASHGRICESAVAGRCDDLRAAAERQCRKPRQRSPHGHDATGSQCRLRGRVPPFRLHFDRAHYHERIVSTPERTIDSGEVSRPGCRRRHHDGDGLVLARCRGEQSSDLVVAPELDNRG